MALVTVEDRYPSAFEEMECPVCGNEEWTHLVFQGVFCKHCNTRCLLCETAGDQGFVAKFDGTCTWAVEDGEMIPETDEYDALASGKWLGSERYGYERYWFSARAEQDDSYDGDWKPAWERETDENNDDGPNYLIELPASGEESTKANTTHSNDSATVENVPVSGGDD